MKARTFPEYRVDTQSEHVQKHAHTLALFRDALHLRPKTIYYPACCTDVSPSIVFPSIPTLYVDKDPSAIRALLKHGFTAAEGDLTKFRPAVTPDLAMMFLAGCPEKPLQHLAVGGYFICDDDSQTATDVFFFPNYSLIAVQLVDTRHNSMRVFTDDLDDYRTKVQTDEELIAVDERGSYRDFYLRHDGATDHFLEAHARLVARAIELTQTNSDAICRSQPWLPQDRKMTEQDAIYLDPQNMEEQVLPLPYRRHAAFYAFRRDS
ncbi:MAG: hypothetical protein WC477_06505 [Patescibacteria group bacterium]